MQGIRPGSAGGVPQGDLAEPRRSCVNSTVVVIVVTVVVLAFFLGGVDIVLARVVERILR